MALYNQGVGAA